MNRNTALILAFCCAPALAQSQQPWDSPAFSADPAAMLEAASKIAAPSGTDAVLLFNDRSYIYDDRGRSTYRQHSFVLVLTANGVRDWDSIEVHWEPWHENRPVLRARAIAPDRSVRELDPKTIAEGPAGDSQRNIYSDGRTMRAPLPAISPGVIVEKEVAITETSALFESGVTHSVSFSADIPVTFSRFTVEAPSSLPLRNEVRLLPKIVTSKSEQDGRVRYTFQMAAAEPTGPDVEYLPPDVPHWPYVAFSTGKSWPDIAKAYSQIVDAQIRSGALEHNTVAAAGKNSDAAEIGAALLKKLHDQVRYTGVEFGDASLIPRSPSETLRRKYGDCKDQATLLVAMLRAAGIPAHVALLLAGPGQDIEPELPGVGIFDHAIVYVPGSPAIWVDPTDEFVRFGELPLDDQGRLALVASETADGLTKIPEAPSIANRFIETREFYLSEFGKARVVETTETWGSVDDRFRQYYADTEAKEIAKGLQGYAKGTYFSDGPPKYEFSKPTDISKPFRLRIEMTNAGRGSTDTLGAAVGITTGGLTTRLPNILSDTESEKETSHRDANFFLPEPYSAEVRCRIVPPPGFKPSALPEAKKRQIGPAVLTEEFSADRDGVVSATLRFDTVKRLLTPAEFEAFRTGLRDLQKEPITLVQYQEEGQALLAAGKIREALEQFRQLVALHPKEALHRTQIARALLAAGAGEQARQEAREATKLEPSSAQAFVTLGWILQHDLIGRRFKKGCDLAGAEAAYRKVKELDPTNYDARADLAIVLENSPDGVRYADKSKLDEAIVEYRLLDGKLTGDISNNILYALLWAKRYDELKELARKNTSAAGSALLLAAVAASAGTDEAIKEASRRIANEQDRQTALFSAGQALLGQRLYKECADLMEAGSSGRPNSAALKTAIDTIRKTRRREDLPDAPNDPAALLTKLFPAILLPNLPPGTFMNLLSASSPLRKPDAQKRMYNEAGPFRAQVEKSGVSAETAVDIALSTAHTVVDGDDACGLRVRAEVVGGQKSNKMTIYVVKEEGQYRVRSIADSPSLGTEAFARIERGEIDNARRWLDWARDEERLAGGEDPLAGPVFPRFWTKGAPASVENMRYAAASLMATGDEAAQVVPILEKGRERAESANDRTKFDLALAACYQSLKKYEELLTVGRRLLTAYPESPTAFATTVQALRELKRWDELDKAFAERLKSVPDDDTTLPLELTIALARGDGANGIQIGEKIVASGKATAEVYNNLAWSYLVNDAVAAKALDPAQKAVMMANAFPALHTLACLYAEIGKTTEARDAIVQALDVSGQDEPEGNSWYVFGRIAEQFGIRDAAIADYRRVEAPKDPANTGSTTYAIARRRLKILGVQ